MANRGIGPRWGGLQPPAQAGVKSPVKGHVGNPIGNYKFGRKTKSKKLRQVFG